MVALFGPTRPDRNGPYATRSIVLRSRDSVDNTSHTHRPDEGLQSIEPQAGDRRSRPTDEGARMAEAAQAGSSRSWDRIARRIRVPLGFLFAVFYFWRARPDWAVAGVGRNGGWSGCFLASDGIGSRTEERATGYHGTIRLLPKPSVPGIDHHRHRICDCLTGCCGSPSGSLVLFVADLRSGDTRGRGVSEGAVRRI